MKVLELFAGSRSIGKICDHQNLMVNSYDNQSFPNIDYVEDIFDFDYKNKFIPDMIWASPPCTGFSVACIGRNWIKGEVFTPKTDSAKLGIRIMEKTLEIIKNYLSANPNLIWYIENPRGKMRKAPHWDEIECVRHTLTYCQYGDTRMKPTDIWTNDYDWKPKPMCKNGNPCHISAPRGSQTGTQGMKGNYERSKIPQQLCEEVIKNVLIKYKKL
jgi:hypothetical protein